MQLIEGASQAHKFWSVRIAIAGAMLNAAAVGWTLFQGNIDPVLYASVNMALGIAVAGARVVQQDSLKDGPQ